LELSPEEQLALEHARLVVEMTETPNWEAFEKKHVLSGIAFLNQKLTGPKKLRPDEYSSYFERREGIKWLLNEIEGQRQFIKAMEKKAAQEPAEGAATGELA